MAKKQESRSAGDTILLIVVALVIVTGLAIVTVPTPGSYNRLIANESNAIEALKSYATAQYTWRKAKFSAEGNAIPVENAYCDRFPSLHDHVRNGAPVGLIPEPLARAVDAAHPYQGYWFAERPSCDWRTEFGLMAMPAVYGKAGLQTFLITEEGLVWQKDLQGAAATTTDFNDPEGNGWVIP